MIFRKFRYLYRGGGGGLGQPERKILIFVVNATFNAKALIVEELIMT